jgi:CheY-like chemotaxis protein
MPDGGELHVEAGRVPGTNRVRVSVRDTGHGMDELTASQAFEPFFTTKARGKGTGLGLSTAYGTARAHRGSLTIDSTPGRGTTVTMELPSSPGRVLAAAAQPGSPPASARLRVLVVDDEPMVLRGVARLLQRLGLDPITLSDPRQALELLASGPRFALHVFDVNMPHLDGLTLARRLHERDPEARVLFMSGYNAERLDDDIRGRATVRFVNKPFEMAALSEAVKALLPR